VLSISAFFAALIVISSFGLLVSLIEKLIELSSILNIASVPKSDNTITPCENSLFFQRPQDQEKPPW
jgi:hypothetical protein